MLMRIKTWHSHDTQNLCVHSNLLVDHLLVMFLIFNQHFLDFSLGAGWGMIGINWKQMVFHCHWFFVYCMSPYTYPIFIMYIYIFIYIQIFIIMIHGGNAVYLMLCFATFSFEDEVSPELAQPLIFICHAIHLEVVALGSKASDIQCFFCFQGRFLVGQFVCATALIVNVLSDSQLSGGDACWLCLLAPNSPTMFNTIHASMHFSRNKVGSIYFACFVCSFGSSRASL